MVAVVANPQDPAAPRRLTPPPPQVAAVDWWRCLYRANLQPVSMVDESWWASGLPMSLKNRMIAQPRGRRLLSRLLLEHVTDSAGPGWDFDLPLRRLLLLPPGVLQDLLCWMGAAAQADRLRSLVQREERHDWITALGAGIFEDVVHRAPLRLGVRLTRLERTLTLPADPLERTVRLGVACLGAAWRDDPVLATQVCWRCPRPWASWFGQPSLFSASEALSLTRKLLSERAPSWLPWFE